jgi:sugar lactone lactonase YvrE
MYRIKSAILVSLCLICISGYSQRYYVSNLAGDTTNLYLGANSNAGYRDGLARQALFNGPAGIAMDKAGKYVYVADVQNNIIRRIDILFNTVTTIAGDTTDIKKGLDSNIGYANASTPMAARFNNPWGICVDDTGNLYVADTYNNVIRKIWLSGKVTTYAGKDSAGTTFDGFVNGADSVAEFSMPLSLTIDATGNLYVTDYGNNAIREILASTHKVITLAGHGPDTIGYVNGPIDTAQLYGIFGIALDKRGAVYVSQFANGYNAIRRLYHDSLNTYSGYDSIGIDSNIAAWQSIPNGYRNGYQYIYKDSMEVNDLLDTINVGIRGVLYNDPTGIAFDTSGNLLIADEYNNVIRIFNAKDSLVSTFAGNPTSIIAGYANGRDSLAQFYNPMGLVSDKKGNFYVADLGNNVIRKLSTVNVLGIPNVKNIANTLNVYPNPCSDRLNIISSFNGNADLLDVTGRVVWTSNNFKSPYTLSTANINPGIYFLRITSPSSTEVRKVEILK